MEMKISLFDISVLRDTVDDSLLTMTTTTTFEGGDNFAVEVLRGLENRMVDLPEESLKAGRLFSLVI